MNLEFLRQRAFAQSTTVKVGGTEWKIGKLPYETGRELIERYSKPEADNDTRIQQAFYAALLSKTVLNEVGLAFDSDEARDELPRLLSWQDFAELGQAAMEFNGMGESAKKN